jgi:hypothetical protein
MATISLSMGARQKVQVSMTPAKTLAQALSEFCAKFDLDPSEYSLVHNKKTLDLSLSWRLSGISANATLEVKKAATSSKAGDEGAQIQVAVTLESARHIMSFPSTVSIWHILKAVETEKGVALLTSSSSKKLKHGEILTFYNQPVVNFMSTELSTNTDLRRTTLSGLGVKSGSAVLRVRFKPTERAAKEFLAEDAELEEAEAAEAKLAEQRLQDAKLASQVRQQEESARRAEEDAQRKVAEEIQEQERREQMKAREAREVEQFESDLAAATRASLSASASSVSSSSPPIRAATTHSQAANPSSQMDVDRQPPSQPPRKKFEVIVEPPGPPMDPQLLKTLMEGGMIDSDHSRLHEALRMQQDAVEKANRIPTEPCARDVKVYAPSSTPFDPSSLTIPDDFYEVHAEDVARSKPSGPRVGEEQMKTKAMRDKERLQKLSRFKKCIIRFRFPDRIELQANFYPQEGLAHLEAFVRDNLVNPELKFYLFTSPPTTNVHASQNLRDQGFLPAALVHVALSPGAQATSPFLKPEVISLIQEKTFVPIVHEYKHASSMTIISDSKSSSAPQALSSATSSSMDVDDDDTNGKPKSSAPKKDKKKVPSWFTAGLKKK